MVGLPKVCWVAKGVLGCQMLVGLQREGWVAKGWFILHRLNGFSKASLVGISRVGWVAEALSGLPEAGLGLPKTCRGCQRLV